MPNIDQSTEYKTNIVKKRFKTQMYELIKSAYEHKLTITDVLY